MKKNIIISIAIILLFTILAFPFYMSIYTAEEATISLKWFLSGGVLAIQTVITYVAISCHTDFYF